MRWCNHLLLEYWPRIYLQVMDLVLKAFSPYGNEPSIDGNAQKYACITNEIFPIKWFWNKWVKVWSKTTVAVLPIIQYLILLNNHHNVRLLFINLKRRQYIWWWWGCKVDILFVGQFIDIKVIFSSEIE
jgi:hypothetical protein